MLRIHRIITACPVCQENAGRALCDQRPKKGRSWEKHNGFRGRGRGGFPRACLDRGHDRLRLSRLESTFVYRNGARCTRLWKLSLLCGHFRPRSFVVSAFERPGREDKPRGRGPGERQKCVGANKTPNRTLWGPGSEGSSTIARTSFRCVASEVGKGWTRWTKGVKWGPGRGGQGEGRWRAPLQVQCRQSTSEGTGGEGQRPALGA